MSFTTRRVSLAAAVARVRGSATSALLVSALVSAGGITFACAAARPDAPRWSAAERAMLRSLSLASLGPLPHDPSNRHADDPRAAALGHRLFFDTRLSVDGRVACATCHVPSAEFQDGTPLAAGVGTTARRTIAASETAYDLLSNQFLFRPRGSYFLPETGNMRTFVMVGRI